MVKNGDPAAGAKAPYEVAGSRKTFWRSASWSSSRSAPNEHENEPGNRTSRSQHNWKSRLCLPPLQPLTIERRSLDEWPRAGSDDIGVWPQLATPRGTDVIVKGERLKLDMPTIKRSTDVDQQFGRKDKECSKVADHIYLGGDIVARDRDLLKQNGITHILNCVGFVCPEYFKDDFVYRTLWLQDKPSEDITSILYDVFDYFEDVREQSGKVFVHCCHGVSRSTSLVIAYLMWREGQSFDDAFQYVKAARNVTDPNMGFACQLLQCQKRVHAFPLSPNSLLRMYRIAPHSSYDPLHLVPKMLSNPSPSALDSRGAFIINIPSAVYIWVGVKCEAIMEKDARGAVCQIVRYEKVQGSIVMAKEGEEPPFFWDAFSKLLPLMDTSDDEHHATKLYLDAIPGERKVDLYDMDYEIFKKAITGGFVPPFASSGTELETHLPVRESSWSLLRRKFTSGNMKEFLSARTSPPLGVHLDSSSRNDAENKSAPKSSHSTQNFSTKSSPSSVSESSAGSPLYLSPSSFDSGSSNDHHYSSESSSVSTPKMDCELSLPSTSSALSNTCFSHQTSLRPETSLKIVKSNNPEDVTQNRRLPVSLAERRGSLSKNLKLSMLNYHVQMGTTDRALDGRNDTKIGGHRVNQDTTLYITDPPPSCNIETSDKTRENYPTEGTKLTVMNLLSEYKLKHLGQAQPMACHWPSLERISIFSSECMTPKAAILFISSRTCLWENGDMILYLWVGRSYNFHGQKVSEDGNESDNLQKINQNPVIDMGIPYGTAIQIVREGEEPLEFLGMLGSL